MTLHRFSAVVIAVSVLCGSAYSQATPATPAAATNALPISQIDSASLRDPFWPVGFQPARPKEEKVETPVEMPEEPVIEETPLWEDAIKTLIIRGIMQKGAGYVAMINDQVISENDAISSEYKNRRYTWRVTRITQTKVKFEKLSVYP